MSHQVDLSKLQYSNINLLKEAIAKEGLETTVSQHGWMQTWKAGEHVNGGILEFGIKIGQKSPIGVYKMPDNTYKLIGDEWNVSYKGVPGLRNLSSRLDQRYRIAETEQFVNQNGWEIVSMPADLVPYDSKEGFDIVIAPVKETVNVGMYI